MPTLSCFSITSACFLTQSLSRMSSECSIFMYFPLAVLMHLLKFAVEPMFVLFLEAITFFPNDFIITQELSVEQLSMTITSIFLYVWFSALFMASATYFSQL